MQQLILNQVQQPETALGKNDKKTNAGNKGKAAVVEAEEIEQNPGKHFETEQFFFFILVKSKKENEDISHVVLK